MSLSFREALNAYKCQHPEIERITMDSEHYANVLKMTKPACYSSIIEEHMCAKGTSRFCQSPSESRQPLNRTPPTIVKVDKPISKIEWLRDVKKKTAFIAHLQKNKT
jgi:hypothetical protein